MKGFHYLRNHHQRNKCFLSATKNYKSGARCYVASYSNVRATQHNTVGAMSSAEIMDPQVTIAQGTLCGKFMRTRKGRTFCAFQGIPYAQPPVGPLRFQSPQEPIPWLGLRPCKTEGPQCSQADFLTNSFSGEEDCLYLNIYTPNLERKGSGFSVMVWIHGGGYFAGSGATDLYGPDFLLDHDVVLVTINYRLAVFGFMSMGTNEAPGNYGLKDQVAALRWVKKNIYKFGGNPNCVTIFGESAGGASVHYLMLSPLARGLFHRAVVQSGTAHDHWARQHYAATKGRDLAMRLGCKDKDVTSMVAYLRNVDVQKLTEIDALLRKEKRLISYFGPCIEPPGTEGAFLTEDPRLLLARGDVTDVPVMAGFTTHEGLLDFARIQHRNINVEFESRIQRCVPFEFGLKKGSPQYFMICEHIFDFYQQLVPNDVIERYVLLTSDIHCTKGMNEFVRGLAALRRSPIFYYSFSYDGHLGFIKKVYQLKQKGTCHMDELGYLFSRTIIPDELAEATSDDHVTIDRMTKIWVNFANTGNPTPDASLGVLWEPVTSPLHAPALAHTRYLDIGKSLTMRNENLNSKSAEFWYNLVAENQPKRGKL